MSTWVRSLLACVAVLAGVSPLLWVTANEYRVLAEADAVAVDRETLLRRATELVHSGSMEDLAALVRETKDRHPDDDSLAREMSMILLQGAHSTEFGQPSAGEEIPGDSH